MARLRQLMGHFDPYLQHSHLRYQSHKIVKPFHIFLLSILFELTRVSLIDMVLSVIIWSDTIKTPVEVSLPLEQCPVAPHSTF